MQLALVKIAKAAAWLDGRNYVIPQDVREQFSYVVGYRILTERSESYKGTEKEEIIKEILEQVKISLWLCFIWRECTGIRHCWFWLFIFLTLQVHICKRQLQVRFVRRTAAAVKEVPFLCELSADYKGKLPAGCIRFYLQCGYGNQKEIKRLYGNVGKDAPGFALCFPYCGTAVIRLQKFRVYDYLFLGSVQKELSDEMQIMVFPKEKALSVRRVDGAEEYQEKSGVFFL